MALTRRACLVFCCVLKQKLWQVAQMNLKSVAKKIDYMPTGRARAWGVPDDLTLETWAQAVGDLSQLKPNGLKTATHEATFCYLK